MKRFFVIALMLVFLLCPIAEAEFIIDEQKVTTPVTRGVSYTNIRSLSDLGWSNIHVLKADMNEPGIKLKVLTNDELYKKSTVKEFVKNCEGAVGGINGDFFTDYTGGSSPEGMIISDGELITTPSNDSIYATLATDGENGIFTGHFKFEISVTSEKNGAEADVLFYNKLGPTEYLKVFDSNYGKYSPGSENDGYEVVVEDGVVTAVYSNEKGIEIPENGYVLANSLRTSLFLMQNFEVGDKVTLDISLSPDISGITEAVGGGTILVKNGKKATFTLKDGRNPQTALGYDADSNILYLVNVEGRSDKARGMTFSEVANLLVSYGCTEAISLDGGGSTAMAVQKPGGEIEHVNSQSYFRPVVNSIGITAEKGRGELSYISAFTYEDSIRLSESVPVYMYAYDEYMNNYNIGNAKITYSADKKGEFVGNVFYPGETGKVKLKATVNGISGETEIRVMENKPADGYKDELYKHSEKEGFTIGIFGDNGDYNTLFTQIVTVRRNKYASEADVSVFRQVPTGDITSDVKSLNRYFEWENEHAAIVCLNNGSASLVESESSQWQKLLSFIEKTKNENILIMLKKPFSSIETEEREILLARIRENLGGRNVFIVSYGDEYGYHYDDGIRYVTMSDLPLFNRKEPFETLSNCRYGLFTITDEGIGFEFVSYFGEAY